MLRSSSNSASPRYQRRPSIPPMTWREYHEFPKHSIESLRRAPHVLDWANMPDPFRHYEDVPVLDLPTDPPVPETPALEVLDGVSGTTPAGDGSTFLSQLLFYSAAISASKRVPSTGYRYALRVNPSSGNLHPTEFHFRTRGLKEWRCAPISAAVSSSRLSGERTSCSSTSGLVKTICSFFWVCKCSRSHPIAIPSRMILWALVSKTTIIPGSSN